MGKLLAFPAAVKSEQAPEASVQAKLEAIIEKQCRLGNVIHDNRPEVLAHLDCVIVGLEALIDARGWRARAARHRMLADIRTNVDSLRDQNAFAMGDAA